MFPYFLRIEERKPFIANIQYDGAIFSAAIFPRENKKIDATIMQSDLAMERNIVGLHLFDFPCEQVEGINV